MKIQNCMKKINVSIIISFKYTDYMLKLEYLESTKLNEILKLTSSFPFYFLIWSLYYLKLHMWYIHLVNPICQHLGTYKCANSVV